MWDVDYYLQVQDKITGAVSGGVETTSHPRYGESSFDNSQTWYCYYPDPWTTFQYAATAAYAARVLALYDSDHAAELATSAQKAWDYAEEHRFDLVSGSPDFLSAYNVSIIDSENLASVMMYALFPTNTSYLEVFSATSRCPSYSLVVSDLYQMEAAATYVELPTSITDNSMRTACSTALQVLHSVELQAINNTAFRFGIPDFLPGFQTATPPSLLFSFYTVLAEGVTDESIWHELALQFDFRFGANPLNTAFFTDGSVSGILGSRTIANPLRVDSFNMGDAILPPPGIAILGPINPSDPIASTVSAPLSAVNGITGYPSSLYPATDTDWPFLEYFADCGWPFMGEYTPQSTFYVNSFSLAAYIASMAELGYADFPSSSSFNSPSGSLSSDYQFSLSSVDSTPISNPASELAIAPKSILSMVLSLLVLGLCILF